MVCSHGRCRKHGDSESATDQRTVLNLHVTVGNQTLMDRIEWDMTEPDNDPELFASQLCSDLGLGGEFQSAIAYSIRGTLQPVNGVSDMHIQGN